MGTAHTTTRHALIVGAVGWAVVGAAIALTALPDVNAGARWFVAIASVIGPTAALLAAHLLRTGRDRLAGLALVISVATPTYFGAAVNVVALLAGVLLAVRPPARRVRSIVS